MIGNCILHISKIRAKAIDMSNRAEKILNKPYARRLIRDEGGGYVVSIQEFPGCIAEGDTPEEAINNFDKAAASWIEVALSNGYEIREPVSFFGHSGKIALRLPRGLHKQVAELAELEESSLNNLLVTAIAEYLGRNVAYKKLSEAFSSDVRRIFSDGLVSLHPHGPTAIVISIRPAGNEYYSAGTIIEGQTKEKTFSIGRNVTQTGQLLLGTQLP